VQSLFNPGPAGRLEALAWGAQDEAGAAVEPRAAALVCHPHPLLGGTLHNNVVFRIARGLQRAGLAALRFNFRGVEQSEGRHDGRGGEEEDARAALDWLAARHPGLPLWAAGFSFGARTVAGLAEREPRIARLVCVALPCRVFDCSVLARLRQPALCLMAGGDQYGTLADLQASLEALPPGVETEEIADVDHFFRGATPQLESRVRAYALRQLEPTA
jgi:alpha/beta superfamily hydrolase